MPGSPRDAFRRRAAMPTRTGVRFDPLLPFEVWVDIGARLGTYSNASRWWLGDWLVFGRDKYGARYRTAIASTGLDYQTLRNYAVVARRFEPSRRRHALTFQHHADVCALPDALQDEWLDRAAGNGWSRNELRRRLLADRSGGEPAERQVVRLAVPGGRVERWRLAATSSGSELCEWMLRVLDDAARALATPAGGGGGSPAHDAEDS